MPNETRRPCPKFVVCQAENVQLHGTVFGQGSTEKHPKTSRTKANTETPTVGRPGPCEAMSRRRGEGRGAQRTCTRASGGVIPGPRPRRSMGGPQYASLPASKPSVGSPGPGFHFFPARRMPPPPQTKTELCDDDHAPVTRGRMRAQYPLPHGQTKGTVVGNNEMYNRENLVGPDILGPRPPLLSSNTSSW